MTLIKKKVLVRGIGASPGTVTGIARVVFDPSEALEKLRKNDLLVTSSTDPSWTICMRKAKGIVVNMGGVLCHAAIVAREMGMPCVVGTINGTEKIPDGLKITIDGVEGVVYKERD